MRTRRQRAASRTSVGARAYIVYRLSILLLLERLLQIFPRFIQRALSVVVGLQRLAVFISGALALSRDVKDLSQLNVAPDLGPPRLAIAVQAVSVGVGRSLEVALEEENLGNTIVGQRTVLVDVERFVELQQRAGKVSLLGQPLAALNGSPQPDVG